MTSRINRILIIFPTSPHDIFFSTHIVEVNEKRSHTMSLTYVALVHKARKKGADYGVMFPDFPGCVFGGKTIDKALENAREGIIFHIEGLLDIGQTLPEPSSFEAIEADPEYKQGIPSLIRVIVPTGHLKRLNISMDAGLIAEIDHAAKVLGKNRSEFLADAAKQILA